MEGDELAAMLFDRGYPLHLVPHLNRFLVRHVFARPRDKHGQLILRSARQGRSPSPAEEFAGHYRQVGMAAHRVAAMWAAHRFNRPARGNGRAG